MSVAGGKTEKYMSTLEVSHCCTFVLTEVDEPLSVVGATNGDSSVIIFAFRFKLGFLRAASESCVIEKGLYNNQRHYLGHDWRRRFDFHILFLLGGRLTLLFIEGTFTTVTCSAANLKL